MTLVNIRWYDGLCVQHAGIELASSVAGRSSLLYNSCIGMLKILHEY